MKRPKRPKSVLDLPLVEVVWIDAALAPEAGGSLNEPRSAPTTGLLECRDLGYLIELTKKEIKLAVSVSTEDNSYRHINSLPRGWAKSIIYLTRPEDNEPDDQLHSSDKGPVGSPKADKSSS
jgi:hypothetical protein